LYRIVNASPLILLSQIGRIDLLNAEGVEVVVPLTVLYEVTGLGLNDPSDPLVRAIDEAGWDVATFKPPIPGSVLRWRLDPGEESVLAVALENPGELIGVSTVSERRTGGRKKNWRRVSLKALRGHKSGIKTLAMTADGRLVSGDGDGEVLLWDLNAAPDNEAVRMTTPLGQVYSLLVLPGDRIVATGNRGRVMIWSTSVDQILARAEAVVGRNLTRAEWARYNPGQAFRPTFDTLPVSP
jgi:hypothetical protein